MKVYLRLIILEMCVWSLDRLDSKGRPRKGKVLKQCLVKGYYIVSLSKDNKQTNKYIHRLIAEAFLPNENNLPVINHINGDKTDNGLENLEWCTKRRNIEHAIETG